MQANFPPANCVPVSLPPPAPLVTPSSAQQTQDAATRARQTPRVAGSGAVGTTDPNTAAREAADKTLAAHYSQALANARWTNTEGYGAALLSPIPGDSTFGQWWQQYKDALDNPGFVQWGAARGLDFSSILLEPHSGFLTGTFNGKTEYLRLETDPEWKDVSGPVLSAAKVLAPPRSGDNVVLGHPGAGASLEVVGNFYVEHSADLTREQAQLRGVALKKAGAFPAIAQADTHRSPAARGSEVLRAQQKLLADIDDRHSVITADPSKSSQNRADSAIALHYSEKLRTTEWRGNLDDQTLLTDIPRYSTFGQWWRQYCDTFKSPVFQAWVLASGLDLSTLVISTRDKSVTGEFFGQRQTRRFEHDAAWAAVAAPVLAAGAVVSADRQVHSLRAPTAHPDNCAPLQLVGLFYGENPLGLSKQNGLSDATRIAARPGVFSEVISRNAQRSIESLQARQLESGQIHDRYQLTKGLNQVIDSSGGATNEINTLLETTMLSVHPHSPYAQTNAAQTTSLKHYLQGCGLDVPGSVEQLRNLLTVLSSPLPSPPSQGNYWPLLGKSLLSSAQRAQVVENTAQILADSPQQPYSGGVIKALVAQDNTLANAAEPNPMLRRLLASPQAVALGKALESKMQGKPTATSATDWAATAMVLDLDPAAGARRNQVAGYDLGQPGNWGATPGAIINALASHLSAQGNVARQQAPAAARLLLAGAAPQFLVNGLPANLVYGSHTWASFSAAVTRIEKMAPGTSQGMSFEQVMAFGHTQPLSADERSIQTDAQRDALIDWGIANGLIAKRADDSYPNESIELAKTRFNQQLAQLTSASEVQHAALPTRKAMALAQLKAALGDDIDFETLSIRPRKYLSVLELFSGPLFLFDWLREVEDQRYSILELYMSGALTHSTFDWVCDDRNIPFERIKTVVQGLPNIKQQFHEKIDAYTDTLKDSMAVSIRNLIAQLPLEDRQNLEFGHPKLYSVREGFFVNSDSDYADQAAVHRGHYGLLIRTDRTSPPTDYELFPALGILRRKDGLPVPLPLGPSNADEQPLVFDGGVTEGEEAGQPLKLDTHAYLSGRRSNGDRVSDNVILDNVPVSLGAGTGLNASDEPSNASSVPRSFFTKTTHNLAKTASDFFLFNVQALKDKAEGTTRYEHAEQLDEKIKDTLINLIPFVSSYKKAQQGDYTGAFVDAELDAFGFLAPGAGAIEEGEGVTQKIGSRVIGSVATSQAEGAGKAPLSIGNRIGTLASEGFGINRQHVLAPTQLDELVQSRTIAEGSIARGTGTVNVLAHLDEASQKWYAYDAQLGQPYGPPLEDFKPRTSAAPGTGTPSLLERGLAQDNVIEMGGSMKNLKLIGSEIHTFTDTYKSASRLNIVAHGSGRDWLDRLLHNGSEVVIDGKGYNAKQLLVLLRSKGVDPASFDSVRLLVCHSADGKGHSFASQFQKEIQKPVKAFEGRVAMNDGSTAMSSTKGDLVKDYKRTYPALTQLAAEQLAENKLRRDFENKVTVAVEKRHGNVILMNTATLGKPPKNVLKKVTYLPHHFN